MAVKQAVRVLVVDDSAVAREILVNGLSLDPGIEVVGKASDVYSARDRIVQLNPDVMTLDIQMPGMDGIEFLQRLLPQFPLRVIVVSSLTTAGSRQALAALDAGALEVVGKPAATDPGGLPGMIAELSEKIKEVAAVNVAKLIPKKRPPLKPAIPGFSGVSKWLIALGASTGGTTALSQVISALPANLPPVVVVQHMPPVFTKMFADSLDKISALTVVEATDGLILKPGLVAIAPGNFHTTVAKSRSDWIIRLNSSELVSGHRPSVDVMFHSVASNVGSQAVGVLMTGMGRDGASGLLAMRMAGCRCLAQDEASSVVFGMPKAAWDNGAAERLVSLDTIAPSIVACVNGDARQGGPM